MQERNIWKPETDSKTLSAGLSPMEGREKKVQNGKWHEEIAWNRVQSSKSHEISEADQHIWENMKIRKRGGSYSWKWLWFCLKS